MEISPPPPDAARLILLNFKALLMSEFNLHNIKARLTALCCDKDTVEDLLSGSPNIGSIQTMK
jgi:hypothetical protein